MTEQGPIDHEARKRRRRRFGLLVAALGTLLLLAGTQVANRRGTLGFVGLASVGYGIGLLVAGAWLVLGYDPADRRRH